MRLETIENFIEGWLENKGRETNGETGEEYDERKRKYLPELIDMKLTIMEEEYITYE